MRPNSDGRRLSKSAAGLDARVAVTCLVDARPSGWCQRRCIAGQSERVKDRHRDSDGGQRDNCHEDHEAGGCDEPTVFHALAVGQHAMDPRRRHNGHMLFLLRGVYSGRLLWAGARMLPPGFENSGLKVGARNREAALRLTSNERLLDFFEDGSHRCGPQRKGDPNRRATRARRSPSELLPVMSIPLSISPSMSARIISARLSTLPLVPRMSVDNRSRWRICRSKSTTETLDHVSWWTGGRPRPALFPVRDTLADPAPPFFFAIVA